MSLVARAVSIQVGPDTHLVAIPGDRESEKTWVMTVQSTAIHQALGTKALKHGVPHNGLLMVSCNQVC